MEGMCMFFFQRNNVKPIFLFSAKHRKTNIPYMKIKIGNKFKGNNSFENFAVIEF